MYTSPAANAAAPVGVLALTGMDMAWYFIAAVALIGLGGALLRFIPRKEK